MVNTKILSISNVGQHIEHPSTLDLVWNDGQIELTVKKHFFFPWGFFSPTKHRVAWLTSLWGVAPPLKGVWSPTIHVSMFRRHSWWYIPSCGQKTLYYSLCCSHPILCRFSGAFCWYRTLAGQPAYSCGWETSSLLKSPVPVDTQRVRANASSKRRLMLYFWLRSEGPVVGEGKIMIKICHGLIRNSVLNFKDKLVSQSINSDKLDPPNHGIPYKKRETSRSPDSGTPAWLKILDPHHGTTPT